MIIELSRSFATFDACPRYLSSIVPTFFFLFLIDKMFYSKEAQGPFDAVSLKRDTPTEGHNNQRVKVRILFVPASFTFMNPSCFHTPFLLTLGY